jgi:hypothetical protein
MPLGGLKTYFGSLIPQTVEGWMLTFVEGGLG